MRKNIITLLLCFLALSVHSRDIYAATTGSDTNDGSKESPYLTIHKAVDAAQPGETIWVRGGRYMLAERIKIPAKATTADARICLWGYPGEQVILDGSAMQPQSIQEFKMSRCIYVNHEANYWHFKNLEMCNARDNGMKIEGSYNIVENCKFYDNNDTGLQIGMYKDFTYEETKSLPSGTPQYNPGYQFCKYNIVINCDSYYNFDEKSFTGTDDGGDADGFACKLFPGPGTEFIGCRAWNNSDDNWDLYMVYHPVRIDNCWTWKAGYDKNGTARKNGNGFKLGGGGTSGGAAFAQSVGAHVVTNCISFDNLHKGFDQNNAFEAMYLFNNIAWGNEYNYRFPTIFQYGSMYMRNNIGFKPTVLNHEFLSADKTGAQVPNTTFNSWTTLDGCDPYKDGNKVNGGKDKIYAKDYSSQFKSLSTELAMAPRNEDGSLPDNDFCRLIDKSLFIDKGENIVNFTPARFMTPSQANGLELIALPDISIPYNDDCADMGAFETGVPTKATMKHLSGSINQLVYRGDEIEPIVYSWGQAATGIKVEGLPGSLSQAVNETKKTLTISGTISSDATIKLTSEGGENTVEATLVITVSDVAPATLQCVSANSTQTVNYGSAIGAIVFEMGGGATQFVISSLPNGLDHQIDGNTLTISGTPTEEGGYSVTATGGMRDITLSGYITRVIPTKILTGDWYNIQDSFDNLPADLDGVISLIHGGDAGYPTIWNPEYSESGSVPSGCTKGAVNMERKGGGIEWNLPSLIELKVNLHFTGKRTLKIVWSIDGGAEQSWTSSSMSKTTLTNWDIMANAGIEATQKPIVVKLINTVDGGGTRLYDFFVRTYDMSAPTDPTSLENRQQEELSIYRTSTALVAQGKEIAMMRLFNTSGDLMTYKAASQVLETGHIPSGLYILQVITREGKSVTKKVILN